MATLHRWGPWNKFATPPTPRGKAHIVAEFWNDTRTRCGLSVPDSWWLWDRKPPDASHGALCGRCARAEAADRDEGGDR